MSDVRQELRTLVERFGPGVLADAEGLRSLLDDVLEEDASPTETNLVVDAVRYGAVERLRSLVEHGARPEAAVRSAGDFLAAQRGGTDERSATWACQTVGHALGIVPDQREDRTQRLDETVPATGPPDGHDLATTRPIRWQEPPTEDRLAPVRRGPRWGALGPRPRLAAVAGVVTVLAVVTAVTTFVLVDGERQPSTTRSLPDVARTYAALGSTLTRGATDPCSVRDPAAGQSEALSCDYGRFTMSLTTYADQAQLAAHRHELVHEQARSSDLLIEEADGTYLERRLPDDGHLLYWDSTDALQSAAVETSGGGPSLEQLRAWFQARGVSHLERLPGPRADTSSAPPTTSAPPAPFESATLYAFARPYFDPDECFLPEPGEFEVLEIVPDTEVVKCDRGDTTYAGTFWCHADLGDLVADREEYVSRAVDGTERPVSGRPAGRSERVDGVALAFNHLGSNDARVYWDSPRALCAAEVQAYHDDVDATVDFWRTGSDG